MVMCQKLSFILFNLVTWYLSFVYSLIRRRNFSSIWFILGLYNYWWNITSFKYSLGKKETRMFYVASVITFSIFSELLWRQTLVLCYNLYRFRPPLIESIWCFCTLVWRKLQVNTIRLNGVCPYWPPSRVVFPNHEVVVLKTWTGNTPLLGSITYCCVANYLSHPAPPTCRAARFPSWGGVRLLTVVPYRHFPSSLHTGSSAHLGIPYLCPIIPKPL